MFQNNNKGEMNGVKQGKQGDEAVEWSVGLVSCDGKYLTAETFGYKINASGTTMRKKQLWVIEHDKQEDDVVYIRSHLNRYLTTDKKGVATCESEEKEDAQKFKVEYSKSGKWSFKSKLNGYYFGGTADELKCYEKTADRESEKWTIRLAIHPQVNLRNVNRKKYAHLAPENQKIQCDELIPWGQDALITLEFIEVKNKYAVKSCEAKYLCKNGDLVAEANPKDNNDILFDLEIHSSGHYSGIAFKDNEGKYLTAIGRDAVMQSNSKLKAVSKDELFTLEDSHPQVFITAHNNKMVSIKQGVDLTANQDELSDTETFQVEYDKRSGRWRFRSAQNKYWVLSDGNNGITNTSMDNRNDKGLFDIEWLERGQVGIKASNGKYISARPNGSLYAVSDSAAEDKARYYITIINRPLLVLKCDYGFVGFKSSSNPRIECNKANIDVIHLETDDNERGVYYLKGHNGKYWSEDSEGMINADSSEPKPFRFEMRRQSRFTIRTPSGNYIKGEQNGIFSAKSADLSKATHWEY